MTTPGYEHKSCATCTMDGVIIKEEIRHVEIVMLEGGNTSVNITDFDKLSPDPMLSDKHEISSICGRNISRRNTDRNNPGFDTTYNTILQDGPEIVVDPTHGEWIHVTEEHQTSTYYQDTYMLLSVMFLYHHLNYM